MLDLFERDCERGGVEEREGKATSASFQQSREERQCRFTSFRAVLSRTCRYSSTDMVQRDSQSTQERVEECECVQK